MANQRKAGKKKVQVWMTEEERKSLEDKAEKKGMTLTEFLKWIAAGMPLFVALLWFQFPKSRPALRSCGKAIVALVESGISAATKALAKL